MFVVAGDKYIHLYDKDLNYLRNVDRPNIDSKVQLVTIYPLNYTLVLDEDDKSMMLIHWDCPNSPTVIQNVEVEEVTQFSSIACLEDSTLCFASGMNEELLRFDIRTVFDQSITSNFKLKVNYGRIFTTLAITDSNLKYLFGIVENDLVWIDPINLTKISIRPMFSFEQSPIFLAPFMSDPQLIIGYIGRNFKSMEIKSDDSFNVLNNRNVPEGQKLKGIMIIRGTRYLIRYSNLNDIKYYWVNLIGQLEFKDPQ